MDSRQTPANKKRLLILLLVQGIILIMCLLYIQRIYMINILPDKDVVKTYAKVNCTLTDKRLEKKEGLFARYRARFDVSYTYAGGNFKSVTFGNGLDQHFTTDRGNEEKILNQFMIDDVYPCWVNPNAPKKIVLILRNNWESIFSLFIPFILVLIFLYFFVQTVFKFVRYK